MMKRTILLTLIVLLSIGSFAQKEVQADRLTVQNVFLENDMYEYTLRQKFLENVTSYGIYLHGLDNAVGGGTYGSLLYLAGGQGSAVDGDVYLGADPSAGYIGNVFAKTQLLTDSTNKVATTDFVKQLVASGGGGSLLSTNNTWTGTNTFSNTLTLTVEPTLGDSSLLVPTTAWVKRNTSAGSNLLPLDNTWTGVNTFEDTIYATGTNYGYLRPVARSTTGRHLDISGGESTAGAGGLLYLHGGEGVTSDGDIYLGYNASGAVGNVYAATQSALDNSSKIATTSYVDAAVAAGGGGGGTPGGSDTQIQYNNAGSLGGMTGYTFDGTNMNLGNGYRIRFGSSNNLQVYSYLTSQARMEVINGGRLDIIDATGETLANFISNGAVNLYHNNTTQLSTSGSGVSIPNDIVLGGDGLLNHVSGRMTFGADTDGSSSGSGFLWQDGGVDIAEMNQDGDISFAGTVSPGGAYVLPDTDGTSGYVLKTNGSGVVTWQSASATPGGSSTQVQYNNAGTALGGISGVTSNGSNMTFEDNTFLNIGTGNDMSIYSNGSFGYMVVPNTAGRFYVQTSTGEDMIRAFSGGAVYLHHDNTQRLETTTTGTSTNGVCNASGGFSDNGTAGVDGQFDDLDGNTIQVKGGIITDLNVPPPTPQAAFAAYTDKEDVLFVGLVILAIGLICMIVWNASNTRRIKELEYTVKMLDKNSLTLKK